MGEVEICFFTSSYLQPCVAVLLESEFGKSKLFTKTLCSLPMLKNNSDKESLHLK